MKHQQQIRHVPRAYQITERPLRLLGDHELPQVGDHLVTPWMGFAHHGLYAGDGKVVHYGALMYDIVRRPVEEVTLVAFAEGRPVFVVSHAATPYKGHAAICRARTRLGEDRYRLLTNNCEHFVEWCLYGVARSFQVATALTFPFVLGEWMRWRIGRSVQRLFGRQPVSSTPEPAVPATVEATKRIRL